MSVTDSARMGENAFGDGEGNESDVVSRGPGRRGSAGNFACVCSNCDVLGRIPTLKSSFSSARQFERLGGVTVGLREAAAAPAVDVLSVTRGRGTSAWHVSVRVIRHDGDRRLTRMPYTRNRPDATLRRRCR